MQIDPTWHQGDVVQVCILVVMGMGYFLSRASDTRERQKARDLQTERHAENTTRLEHLGQFKVNQETLNRQRDEQVNLLNSLAAAATESLKGFNRRLELVENEQRDLRGRRGGNE